MENFNQILEHLSQMIDNAPQLKSNWRELPLESYNDISIRQLELDEWHPDSNI